MPCEAAGPVVSRAGARPSRNCQRRYSAVTFQHGREISSVQQASSAPLGGFRAFGNQPGRFGTIRRLGRGSRKQQRTPVKTARKVRNMGSGAKGAGSRQRRYEEADILYRQSLREASVVPEMPAKKLATEYTEGTENNEEWSRHETARSRLIFYFLSVFSVPSAAKLRIG